MKALQQALGSGYTVRHVEANTNEAREACEILSATMPRNGFTHVTNNTNGEAMFVEIEDDGRYFYFAENINYIGTAEQVAKDIKVYLS